VLYSVDEGPVWHNRSTCRMGGLRVVPVSSLALPSCCFVPFALDLLREIPHRSTLFIRPALLQDIIREVENEFGLV